jgi:hypothetical protein
MPDIDEIYRAVWKWQYMWYIEGDLEVFGRLCFRMMGGEF